MPSSTLNPIAPPPARAPRDAARPVRVCLFGAAPDTGNLGVSALCSSLVDALRSRHPHADLTIFDHARGVRPCPPDAPATRRCGAFHSRRLHRPETLWRIRLEHRLGSRSNPALELIRRADAVLDLSGGDSFTDLYGPRRFNAMLLPKLLALDAARPLVLLPQTFGPYRSDSARRRAAYVLKRASAAWARDPRSFAAMRDLLDDAFDPARHRCTVDLAFALQPRAPRSLPPTIARWLDRADPAPLVALNVSGLIANAPGAAASRFALRADYRALLTSLVTELLADGARVLLVPHVHAPAAHPESDATACRALAATLPRASADRVAILPDALDERETKWVIARADWACATRMHAAIAALSSSVPVATIAYSDKAAGVLDSCAQTHALVDPRRLDTAEALDHLLRLWRGRDASRASLNQALPRVHAQHRRFVDDLAHACTPLDPHTYEGAP